MPQAGTTTAWTFGRPISHRARDGRTGTRALRGAPSTTGAIEDQMLAGLSPEDVRQLEAALHTCIDALT